jgi:membrane-associated phospholipid phosphatase
MAQWEVKKDTAIKAGQFVFDERKFPVKPFILPFSLIVAGFIAERTDPSLDLNEFFQEEIWTENPHSTTTIDNYLQFAPAAAVFTLNVVGIKGRNNLLDESMIYLMSNIIMNTVVTITKNVTHELRPDGSDYKSFPSGHTAEAFLSADFLYQEYRDVSPWYGVAGYGVAATVGYLRMYNNKHWLNDVVAGAGFGMASTRLTYWLYPKIKKLFAKNKPMTTMILPYYNNSTGGITLTHIF